MTTETEQILQEAGIDAAEGIRTCVGKEALFLRLLHKFVNDRSYDNFLAAAEANDWKEADTPLHTLKGLAAQLGMNQLFELGQAALTQMRESQEIPHDAIPELTSAYSRVTEAIKRLPE